MTTRLGTRGATSDFARAKDVINGQDEASTLDRRDAGVRSTPARNTSGRSASPREAGSFEGSLRERVGPDTFDRYFAHPGIFELVDATLRVTVPSRFVAGLVARRYADTIRDVARVSTGRDDLTLDVVVDERSSPASSESEQRPATVADRDRSARRRAPRRGAVSGRYKLDDFLVGNSNRLAYNAACRLADASVPAQGPLFVHGVCGLGKTHLLQGIAYRFGQQNPGANVRYVTGEAFTNAFLSALREKRVDRFRATFRRVHLLCLDDVHFLASKEATQKELMHTFDEIDLGGARIVLASDEHPGAIRSFSQALASRLVGGLVTRLDAPEPELRDRIIRALARRRGLSMDDSAIAAINEHAERSASSDDGPSVREVEGLMTKVEAVARLMGNPFGAIGRLAVDTALGDRMGGGGVRSRPLRVDEVIEAVCEFLEVAPVDLMGRSRHRRLVLGRSLIASLCRELTTQSFPEIARALGRPSHSTVITAHQRFQRQMEAHEASGLPGTLEGLTVNDLYDRVRRRLLDNSPLRR